MRQAVFLDRDGTINEEVDYLDNLADLRLIRGADAGIKLLNDAGLSVVVVTNQSGVARGFFSEGFVELVHRQISKMIRERGAWVDKWYFCPHHPEVGAPPFQMRCTCRKPGTGLVERAAAELGLDIKASFFVGDSLTDLQTAWNAGMKSILVLTGHGQDTLDSLSKKDLHCIDYIAQDLFDASRWITGGGRQ